MVSPIIGVPLLEFLSAIAILFCLTVVAALAIAIIAYYGRD